LKPDSIMRPFCYFSFLQSGLRVILAVLDQYQGVAHGMDHTAARRDCIELRN